MPLTPNTFSQLINFSRASSAQRVNEQSLLETVAAGYPRYDYEAMPNLATNSDFNGTTGWYIPGGSTVYDSAGRLSVMSPSGDNTICAQNIATVPGKKYVASVYVSNVYGGLAIYANCVEGNGPFSYSSPGYKTYFFTANATTTYVSLNGPGSLSKAEIANFTVREVKAKGLLIEEARTNLVTASDRLADVAWSGSIPTIIAPAIGNAGLAPDGTFSAALVTLKSGSVADFRRYTLAVLASTTYTASVYVKAAPSGSANSVRITTNNTLAWNTGGSTKIVLTSEWQRVAVTWTQPAGNTQAHFMVGSYDVTGAQDVNCVGNVLMWGAQLEVGAFATSYIPTLSTFTSRASSASYFGSDGLLKTAASNVARLGYDPATRLPLGLLVEPAATNLFDNSGPLSSFWGSNGTTSSTSNFGIAPDGTTSSSQWTLPNTNDGKYRGMSSVLTEGLTYTVSVFVKRTSGAGSLKFGPESPAQYVTFDLNAMAVTGTTANSVGAVQSIGNGWYRLSNTFTLLSGANKTIIAYALVTTGPLVIETWGSQLEQVSQSLGAELVSNGAFVQDTTGWTAINNGTLSVVSGAMQIANDGTGTNAGGAYTTIATTVGKQYTLSFDYAVGTTNLGLVNIGPGVSSSTNGQVAVSAAGTYAAKFTATATTTYLTAYNNATGATYTGKFDNISVKETAGVDLVTNGDFSSATGWAFTLSGVSIDTTAGKLKFTSAADAAQGYKGYAAAVRGKQFAVTYTIDSISAGGIRVLCNGSVPGNGPTRTAPGTYTDIVTVNDATNQNIGLQAVGVTTAVVDNVFVRDAQNLVLNGTFDVDTSNWTAAAGAALSVVSGRIRVTNSTINGQATQTIAGLTIGRTYQVSALVDRQTSANATLQVSGFGYKDNAGVAATISYNFVATGTSISLQLQCSSSVNGAYSDFDNVTLTDVTELVSNGAFEGMLTGWAQSTLYPSLASCVAGEMQVTPLASAGAQMFGFTTVPGRIYLVQGMIRRVSGTGANVYLSYRPSLAAVDFANSNMVNSATAAAATLAFTASGTTSYVAAAVQNTADVGGFDNISVKDVTPTGGATSYIATTSAAVTRAADVYSSATVTRAMDIATIPAIAPWFNAANSTVYIEYDKNALGYGGSGGVGVLGFHAAANTSKRLIVKHSYDSYVEAFDQTANTGAFNGAVKAIGSVNKLAFKFTNSTLSASVNGGAVSNFSGRDFMISAWDMVTLGAYAPGDNALHGHIKSFSYYPRALSDAEMVALTT